MQRNIGITLILTFLLTSCGDLNDDGARNELNIGDGSSCEELGRGKYLCHIDPGGGSDPDVGGVDDTGKAKRDIWKESVVFHAQKVGKNDELWSSSRCMSSDKEKAMFSSDGRLRVRVVPRHLKSKAEDEKDYDDCGSEKVNLCQETLFNFGKMNITIGVKKPVDTEWTQTATFREVAVNRASPIVDFQIPGGLKSGQSLELGIISVEADDICRSLVDQGFNSENYKYWYQYCTDSGFDRMAIAAVKCAKIELQVVNDYTKNFP